MYKIDGEKYLSSERLRKEVGSDIAEGDCRGCFESDLRRVAFCPAIRRMHDKTQVIPLSNGDTALTRLTHSMQVMTIAEMLGVSLTRRKEFKDLYGEPQATLYGDYISAILRTASLIHDIGNPPFGHFGEISIQNYFKRYLKSRHIITDEESLDFTEFDGNALGLRIVSKLQYTGTLDGLNLTYATLGAYLKYPNAKRSDAKGYVGCHKHGIFLSERKLFDKIVDSCNLRIDKDHIKRHPLAFLVEAADSICYGVMDIEDGYNMNWYDIDTVVKDLNKFIEDHVEKKALLQKYAVEGSDGKKRFSIEKLIGFEKEWESEGKRYPKDRRRLIFDFRERLVDYLIHVSITSFVDNLEGIDYGTFSDELLYLDEYKVSKALSEFTKKHIISRRDIQQTELTGSSVITGLLNIMLMYSFHEDRKYRKKINAVIAKSRLEELIHEYIHPKHPFNDFEERDELWDFDIEKLSPYAKLRVIVDFIGSMTDKYSVELYQKFSGMKL